MRACLKLWKEHMIMDSSLLDPISNQNSTCDWNLHNSKKNIRLKGVHPGPHLYANKDYNH